REDDICCRFGGEEFVAVLPNTSIEAALTVANRLRSAFAIHSPALETRKVHEPFAITASIGVAELKQDEYFESLLRRADQALYQAKNSGRNCCELAG
ncbi:MAG: GGDEF domain-containing protein, partial [Pseudomonas sp.]